jgi:hypothetical protein
MQLQFSRYNYVSNTSKAKKEIAVYGSNDKWIHFDVETENAKHFLDKGK